MASHRRKWFLLAILPLLLIIVFFLPIPVSQTSEVTIHASFQKTLEQVSVLSRWKFWWPDTAGVSVAGDTIFRTGDTEYRLRSKQTLGLVLAQPNQTVYHILTVIPTGSDTTCTLQWKKLSYLRTALPDKISSLFGDHAYAPVRLLQRVKESMEDPVKYYGFPIRVAPVEDSIVLVKNAYASKAALRHQLQESYASLQRYLDSVNYKGRAEKMFYVDSISADSVQVMAGISLAKWVDAKPPFRLMTMPPAHIVVGEYTGDYKNMYVVHQAVSSFMKDHNIMPAAVPYEKMLSDPRTAQDSTHVRMKVYYPPMIP